MNLAVKAAKATNQELLEMLESTLFLHRAAAMTEIGKRLKNDFNPTMLKAMIEAIDQPQNMTERIRGTVSVSHVGVASLLEAEQPQALIAAADLINQWSEPDKSDLLWFLNAEGLEKILSKALDLVSVPA